MMLGHAMLMAAAGASVVNLVTKINIRIDSDFPSGGYPTIGEVKFYDAAGVQISNSGITADADSVYSDGGGAWDAAGALDGTLGPGAGTAWAASGAKAYPQNIWFDFATPRPVASVRIYNANPNPNINETPKTGAITATWQSGANTSVNFTRPSTAAGAYTSHTLAQPA